MDRPGDPESGGNAAPGHQVSGGRGLSGHLRLESRIAMKIRAHFLASSLLASAVLGAAACGASAPPTHQLTRSQSEIRGAEEAGAEGTPKAALHLKMARDHVENAEKLIREQEYDDASLVLKRAEADAQLAIALSREARARSEAEEQMRKVQELKREMD